MCYPSTHNLRVKDWTVGKDFYRKMLPNAAASGGVGPPDRHRFWVLYWKQLPPSAAENESYESIKREPKQSSRSVSLAMISNSLSSVKLRGFSSSDISGTHCFHIITRRCYKNIDYGCCNERVSAHSVFTTTLKQQNHVSRSTHTSGELWVIFFPPLVLA